MNIPEKESNTGQAESKLSIISFILLLLLIISIAFLVYMKNQNADINNLSMQELIKSSFSGRTEKSAAEKLISQIEFDSKEHPVFAVYKDMMIKCTKDNITCLNKKGEVLWTKSVLLNNPLVRVSGSNILVADLNGRYLYVISGKEIKWNQKVDSNIISADINEKGYIAIVKEMKGYKGAVEVYDPYGNWAFTSAKGESFVISAKVLPSCKEVIVDMLDTSGINADAKFEFMNMAGRTISSIDKNNAIFPFVWAMNGDNVVAVSDTEAIFFNSEDKIKWKLDYQKIYNSKVSLAKNVILAVVENSSNGVFSGENTRIKVINSNGEVSSEFVVEEEIVNVESYGSSIAVNTGREVYFTNLKGKLIGKYTSKIDILEVKFFNREEVAVITKNNIVVTRIS